MQSLAVNGFTADQVKAALHAPNRQISFRYELLSNTNEFKGHLGNVISAFISNSRLWTIKRTARFQLRDDGSVDFLRDRIRPYCRIWVPPGRKTCGTTTHFLQAQYPVTQTDITQEQPEQGGWAEFPLGVFVLSTPPRKAEAAGVIIRYVDAYDQLQVLVDDKTDDRHTITAGTNYITAVKGLLDGAGILSQNLAPTALTLPVDLDWPPGTMKLDIIDQLLMSINYTSLWFDENGQAVTQPYISPASRPSEYTYRDDDQSVIFAGLEQGLDLFEVPNKWVLVCSEPDRDPLVSVYTNSNPASPTSTYNRGRTIVDYRPSQQAADQASLDALAARVAYEASQVYEHVTFETAIMPQHSDSDVYTLVFSQLGLRAKYSETSWSMELRAGARMIHEARRVVSI